MIKKPQSKAGLPATVSAPDMATARQLSKAQEALLDVLRDVRVVGLDVKQICKLANVTTPTYYAAFRDEVFLTALEEAVQTMLTAAEPLVIQNIVNKAIDPATKSHHWALMIEKMRGRLEEKSQKPAQIIIQFGDLKRPAMKIIEPEKVTVIEGESDEAAI